MRRHLIPFLATVSVLVVGLPSGAPPNRSQAGNQTSNTSGVAQAALPGSSSAPVSIEPSATAPQPVVLAAAGAGWKRRIDKLTANKGIGVSVRLGGRVQYQRRAKKQRVPASNQKLLLSMALLDAIGPSTRYSTRAAARKVSAHGVVQGDLWILGNGDASIAGGSRYANRLSFPATRLGTLARAVKKSGVKRVKGRIMGSTNYFARDWWATGWKSSFPGTYVSLPTAVTFEGGVGNGRSVGDPERWAARALTKKLRNIGVKVSGKPGHGARPGNLTTVARLRSAPMIRFVRHTNRTSSNFFAEMLGKRLGADRYGRPGTIAKGARAAAEWASGSNVSLSAYDSSGLSYSNRISTRGLTRLLERAAEEPWGLRLRNTLPKGGQGTLEKRLHGVKVRAKTGTLSGYSTLSGWVYLKKRDAWAEFSIMSQGMAKSTASNLEDRIVRILNERAS